MSRTRSGSFSTPSYLDRMPAAPCCRGGALVRRPARDVIGRRRGRPSSVQARRCARRQPTTVLELTLGEVVISKLEARARRRPR